MKIVVMASALLWMPLFVCILATMGVIAGCLVAMYVCVLIWKEMLK